MLSRALIITVGTGMGRGENAVKSLAHGLTRSIESVRPDKVYFVTSRKSREITLPKLMEASNISNYDVVELSHHDDLQSIFNELRPRMNEIRESHEGLYVDFTSGTKAMTSSIAMLGILYEADMLCNVIGERENGVVQMGTEQLQQVSPTFAIIEKKLQNIQVFFNTYQYRAALEMLDNIKRQTRAKRVMERVAPLRIACLAYREWDLFNHEEAFKHLRKLKDKPVYTENLRFLGMMLNAEGADRNPYYIADLINNAKRRGEIEGKYDDAVARLYRLIELLAQHRLEAKYRIDTSNLTADQLPESLKKKWSISAEQTGIQIGQKKAYALLTECQDLLGNFLDENEIRGLISNRNHSILAHGLQPVNKKDYEKLKKRVTDEAKKIIPNLDELVKSSEFPEQKHL